MEASHPIDALICEQEASAENETLGLFVTQQELTVTSPLQRLPESGPS